MRLHVEAVAVLVAQRAEEPGRVVDEGEVVEDPQDAGLQVAKAAEEVDQAPEVLALERDREGVDREVAPVEVLPDRGLLDRGQGARVVVELGAGGGDVDPAPVVDDDRRAELVVRDDAAAERLRERRPKAMPSPSTAMSTSKLGSSMSRSRTAPPTR